jgi:hypothetical protein
MHLILAMSCQTGTYPSARRMNTNNLWVRNEAFISPPINRDCVTSDLPQGGIFCKLRGKRRARITPGKDSVKYFPWLPLHSFRQPCFTRRLRKTGPQRACQPVLRLTLPAMRPPYPAPSDLRSSLRAFHGRSH